MTNIEFLNKIREYVKYEDSSLKFDVSDNPTLEETQNRITDWHYQVGRKCMLQDILKWEQGLGEREFQIRKKKGTL